MRSGHRNALHGSGPSSPEATAILVAAGPGNRLLAGEPKAFVRLGAEPLFVHALHALTAARTIAAVIVVIPRGESERGLQMTNDGGPWRCPLTIVEGGDERQDSVRAGLARAASAELIAVHDAARPFVSAAVVEAVVAAAARHGAAIAAIPAADTVKQVHEQGWIESTPARERMWLAQTPQVFRADLLLRAHEQAPAGWVATDDAALVERLGVRVRVVRGNPENRKITTPEDRRWAEWLLERQQSPR